MMKQPHPTLTQCAGASLQHTVITCITIYSYMYITHQHNLECQFIKGRLQWKITYAYYCLDMFI